MKTLITGGTGLVGRYLAPQLGPSIILSRTPSRYRGEFRDHELRRWAPPAEIPSPDLLGEVDAVVNLAGEPIANGRWSPVRKQQIRDSRVAATRNLVSGLARLERKPSVLVSASAVGYYGDRGDELLDESAPAGTGFVAGLCAAWEAEALEAERHGIRVVCLRVGIALAADGGALNRMLLPFRLGLGGRLGSGRQWMPWIHVEDVVGLILHAMNNEEMAGVVNAVAPQPVTNGEFTRVLGDVLQRPTLMAVPRTALELGLGEMSELLLASQMVVPQRAMASGYSFRHPRLEGALRDVLAAPARRAAA